MKKFGAIVAALAATLLGLVVMSPGAQAAPLTYPTPTITISASARTVASGDGFTITATSSVTCSPLSITFNGVTKSGVGKSLTAHFTAPKVTKPTTFLVTIRCTYSTTGGGKGAALLATTATTTRTVAIKVLPAGSSAGGVGLPNTGGPNVWWFIAGGGAVLLGAGAIVAGRRKPEVAA